MNKIIIKQVTGNSLAVSAFDGDKVFSQIINSFNKNENVELDFSEIDLTITAFLNSSIGKLYSLYPSEKIRSSLKISNLKQDEIQLLKLVIDRAKERFNNPNSDDIDLVNEA